MNGGDNVVTWGSLRLEELQGICPTYAWGLPSGSLEPITLPRPPKLLGVHKSKDKEDGRDTRFLYGVALFAPLKWYLEQLTWVPEKKDSVDPHPQFFGMRFVELSLDFFFATRVPSYRLNDHKDLSVSQATQVFARAARRVGELCKGEALLGRPIQCTALSALNYPSSAAVSRTAKLLCPDEVQSLLGRHSVGCSAHRPATLDWVPHFPIFDSPPLLGVLQGDNWSMSHSAYMQNKGGRTPGTLRLSADGSSEFRLSKKDVGGERLQARIRNHNLTAREKLRHVIQLDPPDYSDESELSHKERVKARDNRVSRCLVYSREVARRCSLKSFMNAACAGPPKGSGGKKRPRADEQPLLLVGTQRQEGDLLSELGPAVIVPIGRAKKGAHAEIAVAGTASQLAGGQFHGYGDDDHLTKTATAAEIVRHQANNDISGPSRNRSAAKAKAKVIAKRAKSLSANNNCLLLCHVHHVGLVESLCVVCSPCALWWNGSP